MSKQMAVTVVWLLLVEPLVVAVKVVVRIEASLAVVEVVPHVAANKAAC